MKALTASFHPKLFAAEDVVQQVLHVKGTQAHQTLGRVLTFKANHSSDFHTLVTHAEILWICFSYQNSEGYELALLPWLAWWVLSGVGSCPQTEQVGSVHTWPDRPWFPLMIDMYSICQSCEIRIQKFDVCMFTWVRTATLMSWPLASYIRVFSSSGGSGLKENKIVLCLADTQHHHAIKTCKRDCAGLETEWMDLRHLPSTQRTYVVITRSLGSGGRPTVSCLWWEMRSVQAW